MASTLRRSVAGLAATALSMPLAVLSAEPPCAVENMGYVDPNVTTVNGGLPVTDAETCQQTCQGLATCQVFTYYINSGGCWLQGLSGVVPELEELPGVWSGPKNCSGKNSQLGAAMNTSQDALVADADAGNVSLNVSKAMPAEVATAAAGTADGASERQKNGAAALPIPLGVCAALAAVAAAVFVGYNMFAGGERRKGAKKARRSRASDLEEASPTADYACDEIPLVTAAAPAPVVAMAPAPMAAPVAAPIAAPFVQARAAANFIQQPPVYAPQAPHGTFTPSPPVTAVQSVQSMTYASEPIATVTSQPFIPREPIASTSAPQDIFSRLDRNHDGVLTREEFNQFATGFR